MDDLAVAAWCRIHIYETSYNVKLNSGMNVKTKNRAKRSFFDPQAVGELPVNQKIIKTLSHF